MRNLRRLEAAPPLKGNRVSHVARVPAATAIMQRDAAASPRRLGGRPKTRQRLRNGRAARHRAGLPALVSLPPGPTRHPVVCRWRPVSSPRWRRMTVPSVAPNDGGWSAWRLRRGGHIRAGAPCEGAHQRLPILPARLYETHSPLSSEPCRGVGDRRNAGGEVEAPRDAMPVTWPGNSATGAGLPFVAPHVPLGAR